MFAITLKFLEAVQRNNNTERFHANYDLYQQEKKRFWKLVQQLLDYGKELNPNRSEVQLKQCIFRFNRDIRYRVDKSPYKDHFGCEIAAWGKRSGRPCFYFELRPGGSFVGIGTWRAGEPFESKMRNMRFCILINGRSFRLLELFCLILGRCLDLSLISLMLCRNISRCIVLKKLFQTEIIQ